VVFVIMQDAGIFAAGDDGRIGELAAAPDKFVGELGFELHFIDARLEEAADAAETGPGDIAGFAEQADFGGGLDGAKPVRQPAETLIVVQGVSLLDAPDKTGLPGFDDDLSALVFVGVEVDVIALAHETMEEGAKVGEPLDPFYPGNPAGFFFAELMAFPGFQVRVG